MPDHDKTKFILKLKSDLQSANEKVERIVMDVERRMFKNNFTYSNSWSVQEWIREAIAVEMNRRS